MLEKIGLPPKPSLRGNNWVIDATHCQGCSSQFTFINRKHHCRRCGGIFCGSCTQQRMYLRGQGDAPVRICEPCKTLEEAARFEMRYGHKNKSRKGTSKLASDNEDDASVNGSVSSDIEPVSNSDMEVDLESTTPEELRQRAIEEKNKYKVLKAEKKPEEALKAFKRGKELERQAAALEIELRKNRKKASSSTSLNENPKVADVKKSKNGDDLVSELRELGWSDLDLNDAEKKPVSMTLEGELSTLLKEVSQKANKPEKGILGIDRSEVIAIKKNALALKREGKLTEAKEELKRAKILEKQIEERELLGDDEDSDDEFTSLIRSMDIDKQDILSHGNDQNRNRNPNFDFDHLLNDGAHLDGDFDVTEEDMDDPEMSAALQSLGWSEDHEAVDNESRIQSLKREALDKKRGGDTTEALALLRKAKLLEADSGGTHDDVAVLKSKLDLDPKLASKSKMEIQRELLALKKKALALRREGKADEADRELANGKALEQRLEELENGPKVNTSKVKPSMKHVDLSAPIMDIVEDQGDDVTDTDMNDPSYLAVLENLGWQDDVAAAAEPPKPPKQQIVAPKKSKAEIQRELLALKRKSLALRRQGNLDEAEEVLKATKDLEAQLAEIENPSQQTSLTTISLEKPRTGIKEESFGIKEESFGIKGESFGIKEEPFGIKGESFGIKEESFGIKEESFGIKEESIGSKSTAVITESNSVKQQILAHKRKALSLKREGKLAEAKEELKQAKLLEKESTEVHDKSPDLHTADKTPTSTSTSTPGPSTSKTDDSPPPKLSSRERFKLQQESLSHKRQALKLRREGRHDEADAEFELAKNLESQLDAASELTKPTDPVDDVSVEALLDPQLLSALREIGIAGGVTQSSPEKTEPVEPVKTRPVVNKVQTEAVKGKPVVNKSETAELEEQIKAEKVKAVQLKRVGKQGEALDALRRAKLLEKKLNSLA